MKRLICMLASLVLAVTVIAVRPAEATYLGTLQQSGGYTIEVRTTDKGSRHVPAGHVEGPAGRGGNSGIRCNYGGSAAHDSAQRRSHYHQTGRSHKATQPKQ